ncbi:hypothetical protein [Streptomyces sp. NPDC048606]|uniref:hypothetical protein n=1 Tax=Streptomyces sp. NPDC048606 TaxID=3154726 RepID=UPI003449E183
MRGLRHLTGACGLLCAAWGAWLLARQPEPWRIAAWLGGAVVVHDGLLAPLVLAVGALAAAGGARPRGVPRAALIVAGSLTLIALPPLLRPGPVANPTVLPLDYPRGWLLAVAALALFTAGYAALRALRRRVGRRT